MGPGASPLVAHVLTRTVLPDPAGALTRVSGPRTPVVRRSNNRGRGTTGAFTAGTRNLAVIIGSPEGVVARSSIPAAMTVDPKPSEAAVSATCCSRRSHPEGFG